jgi:eukaryotic-like serine/threonine-protein kinase
VLHPGEVIDGKYRVVRRLGEGAMGEVYEGHSLRLNRRVAIKVMHAAMAKHRSLVMRFEREAQAAANIGSVHVVDVFDLGDLPNGERYMVMAFLEGESLQARIAAASRLAPYVIAPIVIQLLEGLTKVHQAGIVHRDLKPANIFLARGEEGDDLVKILDFGVCKLSDKDSSKSDVATGVGALLGTLAYMSPEQLEHGSKGLDGRADLYAVGVLLYRAVTGKLPYGASTVIDLLKQLREGHAPRIGELADDVDKHFSAIVHKALEWDRTARFATAKEFRRALIDWTKSVARIEEVLSDFLEAPVQSSRSSGVTVGRVALVSPEEPVAAPAEKSEVKPAISKKRSRRRTAKMEERPTRPGSSPDISVDIDEPPPSGR